MKTAELTGAELDYWVARAEGNEAAVITIGRCWMPVGTLGLSPFEPSTDWVLCGPIIEREVIDIDQNPARAAHVKCRAVINGVRAKPSDLSFRVSAFGPTALVAAMRAYVVSRFGDEVSSCP